MQLLSFLERDVFSDSYEPQLLANHHKSANKQSPKPVLRIINTATKQRVSRKVLAKMTSQLSQIVPYFAPSVLANGHESFQQG